MVKLRTFCALSLLVLPLAAQEPALKIGEAEAKRAAVEKPSPAYPAMARQLKITGEVVVDAIVGTNGGVEEVKVVSGNPILSKSVVDTVKNWRFAPFKSRAAARLSFDFQR